MYPVLVVPQTHRKPETAEETAARISKNRAEFGDLLSELRQAGFETFEESCKGAIHASFWRPSRFRLISKLRRITHGPGYLIILRADGYFWMSGLENWRMLNSVDELRTELNRSLPGLNLPGHSPSI